jgi:hypothetical protein
MLLGVSVDAKTGGYIVGAAAAGGGDDGGDSEAGWAKPVNNCSTGGGIGELEKSSYINCRLPLPNFFFHRHLKINLMSLNLMNLMNLKLLQLDQLTPHLIDH